MHRELDAPTRRHISILVRDDTAFLKLMLPVDIPLAGVVKLSGAL